jgi:hypothetical protein
MLAETSKRRNASNEKMGIFAKNSNTVLVLDFVQ